MQITNSKTPIWYERYKPQIISDLVLPESTKAAFQSYVNSGDVPALLFNSSTGGTGKSSTANAIIKELASESLWINASLERSIDVLRGKIATFASQCSFDGSQKVVVMDEFDYMSREAQAAFRGFLDEYSKNCTFIFTCNYKEKIIEPLLNRLQITDFESFKKEEMIKPIFERLKFILDNEKIVYEPRDLVLVINTHYPSIRGMVGTLQKFSTSGTFKVNESELDDLNTFEDVMASVSIKTYVEMITKVNALNAPDNMYSYLYTNAGKFFSSDKYPPVVLTIAKYQHMSEGVRDKNLNLAACLTELIKLKD